MEIRLHPGLRGRVRAAWSVLDGLDHEERPGFRAHLQEACDGLARRYAGLAPAEIEQLGLARKLYRSVGMDPTRLRPSSEALLRRAVQGKGLYRLDPVVDTGNIFSMLSGLPLGLYDLESVAGDVLLRLGAEGEGFEGIRKGRVNVSGRLCLADADGPFGSPTSDSRRCRVRETTASVLFLLYAPADVAADWLRRRQGELEEGFERWNGGRPRARGGLE